MTRLNLLAEMEEDEYTIVVDEVDTERTARAGRFSGNHHQPTLVPSLIVISLA